MRLPILHPPPQLKSSSSKKKTKAKEILLLHTIHTIHTLFTAASPLHPLSLMNPQHSKAQQKDAYRSHRTVARLAPLRGVAAGNTPANNLRHYRKGFLQG